MPTAAPELAADERRRLDALISELADGAAQWAQTDAAARAAVMRAVHKAVADNARYWAETASRMKGIPSGSQLEGEEWLSGPYGLLTGTEVLAGSLDRLAGGGSPVDGEQIGSAIGGRVTVRALPRSRAEGTLLNGFSAEVWMPPGVTEAEVRASAGLGSREPGESGGVGLVLGAGNITAIPALDVIYELIAHNRTVLLKVNPVMDDMTPVFERALAPLIERDLLRVVTGAGQVGGYLTAHDGIAHVHITGSITTHNAIVFGPGADGEARRAAGEPVMDKPITSELGGVSPIIVVPGTWSKADLRFQAEHVATMRLHNGGYNCIAGQTVLLSSDWPQREAFLAELRSAMDSAPERPAWYPGSDDRVEDALRSYPDARRLGASGGRLLVDARPGRDATALERTEYFAPVLGVVEIPGLGQEFLDAAVERANDDFAGTLGVNVIASPTTIRDLGHAFEGAIARLRYGTVAINSWTGVAFQTAAAPWGAYPGNSLNDVGSGIGVVHNALLLAGTEKTVLRGPFRPFPRSIAKGDPSLFPKPPWFVTARSAAQTGERMVEYQSRPSAAAMTAVFAAAFRA